MATMGHLERFLHGVHQVHATGAAVPETSYYPAISRLLEDVGGSLRPNVTPVIHISGAEAGIPDGGLFLARPSGPVHADSPLLVSAPERGALEVKPPTNEIAKVAGTQQIRKYLDRYGKVLVTTLREWALVVADPKTGKAARLETYRIAASADAFWVVAANAKTFGPDHESEFVDFLKRTMSHDAPLSSPEDLAWLLAAHARTALERIEGKDVKALDQLRDALRDALGLTFEGDEGDWFFRTTLVQTLFYGVFSAWVLWHQEGPGENERFDWRKAGWHLKVPMVSVLFDRIATRATLKPLHVDEVMDWTEDVLARVDRDRFFSRFETGQAVQYFYEPFLQHFDEKLREEFGVWYTPPEVVDYMVERVDQILRTDFAIEAGLADERVFVLDPCVGTGSFLIAVLSRILRSLPDDGFAAADVKQAAMQRVFGFEILPAPYVVAHLQLGLLLAQAGAPLDNDSSERVAVYLTNALTGWVDSDTVAKLPFPEFEEEREAAHTVKRDDRILVVLGNPPYFQYAGVHSAEETGLIERYKEGITTKNSLNDLYVRFYAIAERQIVERAGHGIVSLISNYSYLDEPGFVQVRHSLLGNFDDMWIDNLNGSSRETGKKTPDGKPDPSVFKSKFNPQGIQVGVAIGTHVRRPDHDGLATVHYRDFWGDDKKADLTAAADADDPTAGYDTIVPNKVTHYALRPKVISDDYETWPQIIELAAEEPVLGLNENRGSSLIDPDRGLLTDRISRYLDPALSDGDLRGTDAANLVHPYAGSDPARTRQRLIAKGGFVDANVRRFLSGPMDVQWAYVDDTAKLWNRPRPELLAHATQDNQYLLVRRRAPRRDDGAAILPATTLGDQHVLNKDAYFIPFRLHSATPATQGEMFAAIEAPTPNLSPAASAYLTSLGLNSSDPEWEAVLWWHSLAICYSPRYVNDNPGGIAADWPRIPLPNTVERLRSSAAFGRRLAVLLDPVRQADGLNGVVGPVRRVDGKALQPTNDLAVTAQWGIRQKTGGIFPSKGKITRRAYTEAEQTALGDTTTLGQAVDVHLNEDAFWACVPEAAWDFKIGGFRVLAKWLSYREDGRATKPVLGRPLTKDEAREFTYLAQRLTAVSLLTADLDENYLAVISDPFPWNVSTVSAAAD